MYAYNLIDIAEFVNSWMYSMGRADYQRGQVKSLSPVNGMSLKSSCKQRVSIDPQQEIIYLNSLAVSNHYFLSFG